jgi:hypothetical protein
VLVLVAVVVAGLLVEAAAWCCLALFPSPAHVSRWEFRGARPAPYRNADYFSAEFLTEAMASVRLSVPDGAGYALPSDVESRFFNVAEGRRRTTDQPSAPDNRVLLFGASTVFGQEVPDAMTLASCLQRRLNVRPGPRRLVENYGTPAMIAEQQTERLERTPLHPGDVVLFYDGVNDVFYPIYNGAVRGWRPGVGSDGGVRRLSPLQRWLYPLCFRCKDYSAAARLLFRGLDSPRPAVLVEEATLHANLAAAEDGYRRALVRAQQIAEAQGARFVHVLQPHLFTRRKPNAYERSVAANELKALAGLDQAFALGYPRLRQAAAAAGVEAFDLTAALEEREAGEEYYLDFCHVNHAANERLARAIEQCVFSN